MKRILLITGTTLSMTMVAAPVLAGNLNDPVIVTEPAPMPAPVVYSGSDWTGFYVGGSLGYADASEVSAAFDDDGLTYGVHAGYDYDFGSFVLGGELEFSGFDLADGTNEVDSVARAKMRAGYDAGALLPYLTVGYAAMTVGGLDATDDGAFYGIGMDYMLSDGIRLGGELLQHEFNDFDGTGLNFDATTAAMRVSFQF